MRQLSRITAEITLLGLSLVATVSLTRLFTNVDFLPDLLWIVLIAHLVALITRRLRLGFLLSAAISITSLVLLGSAFFYNDQSSYQLPTEASLDVLREDLQAASIVFTEEVVPVEPVTGFILVAAAFLWLGAFLSDTSAFRRKLPVEALVPATTVFVFSALMGTTEQQIMYGVIFTAAITAVLISLRGLNIAYAEQWSTPNSTRDVAVLLRNGIIFGLLIVAVSGVAVTQIPTAVSQPLYDIDDLNNARPTRNVISPLVSISASLVNQSDDEIFSVRVAESESDYWRLMALTHFDGNQWQRTSTFKDLGNSSVDPSTRNVSNRRLLTQTITKRARSANDIYLPVANELHRVVDAGGLTLEYEEDTGALVYSAVAQVKAEQGFTYTVESLVPEFDPTQLAVRSSDTLDSDFLDEYTQLPGVCIDSEDSSSNDCWPQRITTLAQQVTASASNDYQRVRMLQDFFRNPQNFRYDLNVANTHNIATAEQFLFVVRRGYCEQFASVFAAMARSLGIPARVAVGYTWGTWDAQRQEYVVRGHHAHAWPEVYFADVGWVVFEPTPGRNRGHDSSITGLTEPAQYPSNASSNSLLDEIAPLPVLPTNTVIPDAISPISPNNTPNSSPANTAIDQPTRPRELPRLVLITLIVILAVTVLLGLLAAGRALLMRRWLRLAIDKPLLRAELAWDAANNALELLGISASPQQTPLEFATQVNHTRSDMGALSDLAGYLTTLRYSNLANPADNSTSANMNILSKQAVASSHELVKCCRKLGGVRKVIFAALDPRIQLRLSGRRNR